MAPSRTLQNGLAVRGTAIRVSARDLANAPMGRVGIAPTRNAMLGAHAGQPAAAPPARSGMRPVVSRMTPPASFTRGGGSTFGNATGQKPFAGRTGSSPLTPSRIIPHGPESASGAVPSPALRGAPRPPSSNMQRPAMGNSEIGRSSDSQVARNVPRPPMSGAAQARAPQMNTPQSRGGFSAGPAQRSVPRPPAGFSSRESTPNMSTRADTRPGAGSYGNRPNTAVPRPTGPVRPASQSDRFGSSGAGGYGRQSASPAYGGGYGNSSRSSQSPRSSAPPSYRSSGPSYGGSAPSYRGGSPSYGGGAPSYRGGSAPSYHGGGGAPSYHGGGGGGSSHGGGSGGGGHTSSGGGGGHASSGGRGGHR